MKNVVNWVEFPCNLPDRQIYVAEQINIPGLTIFGYHSINKATAPLVPHYHKDSMEIVYVIKGHLVFFIDNKSYHLYGGDIFITPPNVVHCSGENHLGGCEMYWMHLDLSITDCFLNLSSQWSNYLVKQLLQLNTKVFKPANNFKSLLKSSFQLITSSNFTDKYLATSHILTFIHTIIGEQANPKPTLSVDINKAVNYIVDNIQEEISLDYLSQLCNLSLSAFKQNFKKEVGVTPREFINSQKIELAKTLLLKTDNITDVALSLNFSTSNYFSVVFKRFTGLSPSEYMKQCPPPYKIIQ